METALPLPEVHRLLEGEGFEVLGAHWEGGAKAIDDSQRTYFVCRAI